MTKEQQAAMAVLDRAKSGNYVAVLTAAEASSIVDMLASPFIVNKLRDIVVMPKDPGEDVLESMWRAWVAEDHRPATLRSMYYSIYNNLREHAGKAAHERTEWLIQGRVAPGGVVAYHAIAKTEKERDDCVNAALKCGCKSVNVETREVAS